MPKRIKNRTTEEQLLMVQKYFEAGSSGDKLWDERVRRFLACESYGEQRSRTGDKLVEALAIHIIQCVQYSHTLEQ